jgi:RND family efflux transporter MFP subunit
MSTAFKHWRFWATGGILALATGGVAWAFLYAHHARSISDPERSRRAGRPIPVRAAAVQQTDVEEVIGGTAVTAASQYYEVKIPSSQATLPISGPAGPLVVKRIHIHEGQFVHAGDVLMELEESGFAQVVKARQAAEQSAKAELDETAQMVQLKQRIRELDLQSAKENISYRTEDLANKSSAEAIYNKLLESRSSTILEFYKVRSDYLQAKYDLSEAKRNMQKTEDSVKYGRLHDSALLTKAKSDHESAKTALFQAEQDFGQLKVRAPIDGFLSYDTKPEIITGAHLKTEDTLLHLVNFNPVRVRVDYPQERIDQVRVGQEAELVLDSWPQETFKGVVNAITPHVIPQTRTGIVWLTVDNPNHRIKPGISGFARIKMKRKATVVPETALHEHGTKAMVFCVQEGKARVREVEAGSVLEGGMREVKGGLAPGEEVVIFQGFYRHAGSLTAKNGYLQDGDAVDASWKEWTRRE